VRPLVLKLGGELLETAAQRARIAALSVAVSPTRPFVIVHGGGRAIDAELGVKQIAPRKIDGLRITDAATLEVVVSVLAGSANTALVAALVAAGIKAVGLTGVDAGFGRAVRVTAHRASDGQHVDLGLVGDPIEADPALIRTLVSHGYVPVIASLGFDQAAGVLNVNADVMACRVAAAMGHAELVIAGGTPGVLDQAGRTIPSLDTDAIAALVSSGTATAGMVAKLAACRSALDAGVDRVRIVDGRALDGSHDIDVAPGTTISLAVARPAGQAEVRG
jgi:acetylglutamate kinase